MKFARSQLGLPAITRIRQDALTQHFIGQHADVLITKHDARAARAPPLPAFAQPMPAPTMTLAGGNTAVPRIAQAGFGAPGQGAQQIDVKGTVEGQAKVEVNVKVEASTEFKALVGSIEAGLAKLKGMLAGNVGTTGTQTP